ncbi:hypothetical protein C1H46_042099 [Malus baccata]|uniref:Uncharacterized protein n=1 Tax=Malus baccata TaxID=106549 RepID=A0A540KDQ7_MALBA|nr:hypothetical protein C1H46_042099 [Malus baccata]
MPELAMDTMNRNGEVDESNGDYAPQKESYSQGSPRSTLSPQSPHSGSIGMAMNGGIDTSTEQLYHNICEMQSSDQSPSWASFGSFGEESRIDSELNHLVGYAPEDLEIRREVVIDVSAIYQSMNDLEQALKLLKKALKIFGDAPGHQSTSAGIEAQMGVMYYMMGNFTDSYSTFKSSITKFRATGEKKSALFGIALNQMGLACVQRYSINEAADLFEEARKILEKEYGPYHPDTLGVYSNLAGTYDAMGRLDAAIETLEYVVGMREEKLGTANPDVADEKRRLSELLKEAGRARNKKTRSLETLLDANNPPQIIKQDIIEVS